MEARPLALPTRASALRRWWPWLLSLDLTEWRVAAAFSAVFVLSRLPYVLLGYGAFTDAYRVALSGLHLWQAGQYLPSRLPGYPLQELVTALFVPLGPVATNLLTVFISLAGVFLFDRVVRELRLPARGLLVLLFAFTPFLWVVSATTLDYQWALTALLATYLAVLKRQPWLAGFLLGLAGGIRLTSLAFGLPVAWILWREGRRREIPRVAFPAVVTWLACFSPVLARYGAHFLNYAASYPSLDLILRPIGQYSIGALGIVAVVGVLAWSWRGVGRLLAQARSDAHVQAWLMVVVIWAFVFAQLPVNIAYLLPIYPFAFFLLARAVRPIGLAVVLAAVVFAGVFDINLARVHGWSTLTDLGVTRSGAGLWHDRSTRLLYRHYAATLAGIPVPRHTVVLTGGVFPVFAVMEWDRFHYEVARYEISAVSELSDNGAMVDRAHDVIYLAAPDQPILDQYLREGYTFLRAEPREPDWTAELHVEMPPHSR